MKKINRVFAATAVAAIAGSSILGISSAFASTFDEACAKQACGVTSDGPLVAGESNTVKVQLAKGTDLDLALFKVTGKYADTDFGTSKLVSIEKSKLVAELGNAKTGELTFKLGKDVRGGFDYIIAAKDFKVDGDNGMKNVIPVAPGSSNPKMFNVQSDVPTADGFAQGFEMYTNAHKYRLPLSAVVPDSHDPSNMFHWSYEGAKPGAVLKVVTKIDGKDVDLTYKENSPAGSEGTGMVTYRMQEGVKAGSYEVRLVTAEGVTVDEGIIEVGGGSSETPETPETPDTPGTPETPGTPGTPDDSVDGDNSDVTAPDEVAPEGVDNGTDSNESSHDGNTADTNGSTADNQRPGIPNTGV